MSTSCGEINNEIVYCKSATQGQSVTCTCKQTNKSVKVDCLSGTYEPDPETICNNPDSCPDDIQYYYQHGGPCDPETDPEGCKSRLWKSVPNGTVATYNCTNDCSKDQICNSFGTITRSCDATGVWEDIYGDECLPHLICPVTYDSINDIVWPESYSGHIIKQNCPTDSSQTVERLCDNNGNYGPVTGTCPTYQNDITWVAVVLSLIVILMLISPFLLYFMMQLLFGKKDEEVNQKESEKGIQMEDLN